MEIYSTVQKPFLATITFSFFFLFFCECYYNHIHIYYIYLFLSHFIRTQLEQIGNVHSIKKYKNIRINCIFRLKRQILSMTSAKESGEVEGKTGVEHLMRNLRRCFSVSSLAHTVYSRVCRFTAGIT